MHEKNTIPSQRPVERSALAMWLRVRGISKARFASSLGCSKKSLDFWCDGQVVPTLIWAFRIERATGGGVPAVSWLGLEIAKTQWNELERKAR